MLPSTPITEEVRLPKFVEEEWNTIVSKVVSNAVGGWKSVLYTNYAIINRGEAFNQLLSVPLDDGLTRTWALVNFSSDRIARRSNARSILVLGCYTTEHKRWQWHGDNAQPIVDHLGSARYRW